MSDPGAPLIAMLNREVARAMQAPIADLHARLLGHETAIAALIAALAKTGALPIAEAKQAIDAAAAATADDAPNRPTREVLGRLAKRLVPALPASPPSSLH